MRKTRLAVFPALIVLLVLCGAASAELAAPQNQGWIVNSLATATWDAVAEAEYYTISDFMGNG